MVKVNALMEERREEHGRRTSSTVLENFFCTGTHEMSRREELDGRREKSGVVKGVT